jgi:hypothetical protein
MDNITKNDVQEGRTMAWHSKTKINLQLTLLNCWLSTWDYVVKAVTLEDGTKTTFDVLAVSDDAKQLNDEGEPTDLPLIIGLPYNRKTFKPVFNQKLIELLDKGTEGKDLLLSSCGTVKNRGRQFFSFEMGESYRAAGREFVPYYNVGNGNDKSSPVWENVSATCTVCDNTFTYNMLSQGLIMEVKKTKYSELAFGDFSKAMKVMLAGQKEFIKYLDEIGKATCSHDTAKEFFAGFTGTPKQPLTTRSENINERLFFLFVHGKGNEGKTWADVFSAITDYYTHESANANQTPEAQWKNFVSSEFGNARSEKQRAWLIVTNDKKREEVRRMGKDILTITAKALIAQESVTV